MEVQLFQAQISSTTGFIFVFLMNIASYADASVYAHTSCTDKHIAKCFFDKHDNLLGQGFHDFVANEIPLGLSEVVVNKNHVVPTLSHLHRNVTGEGSHRHLHSSITFELKPKLKPELNARSCEVIIIEKLPSGVFADPFELEHLVQRGVFSDAAVFGDTNLELPSFRSNRSVVEIHMSIASNVLSINKDYLEVNLVVPLHARYPPLGHEFSRVEFGQPDILMCCDLEEDVHKRRCVSMPGNDILDREASPVIWEIPCGIKKHAEFVSAVTFGFAVLASLIIVSTSIFYSDSQGLDKLKRS